MNGACAGMISEAIPALTKRYWCSLKRADPASQPHLARLDSYLQP
jgi:hypothetical protein